MQPRKNLQIHLAVQPREVQVQFSAGCSSASRADTAAPALTHRYVPPLAAAMYTASSTLRRLSALLLQCGSRCVPISSPPHNPPQVPSILRSLPVAARLLSSYPPTVCPPPANLVIRNPIGQQIIASHPALGLSPVAVRATAQRNHQRRHVLAVQLHHAWFQLSMQHRRCSRPEYSAAPNHHSRRAARKVRASRPSLIAVRYILDLHIQPPKPHQHAQQQHAQQSPQQQPPRRLTAVPVRSRTGRVSHGRKSVHRGTTMRQRSHSAAKRRERLELTQYRLVPPSAANPLHPPLGTDQPLSGEWALLRARIYSRAVKARLRPGFSP